MFQILPRFLGGRRTRLMLVVGALVSAGASQAQATHDHSPAPPSAAAAARIGTATATATTTASAATTASPLGFESTLARYKPMTDQKPGSWREANDTVTRIGGWRAYLKEAQVPTPNAPAAANPHAGHGAKQ